MRAIARILVALTLAFSGGATASRPALRVGDAPVSDMPGWRLNFVDSFSQDIPLGSWTAAKSGEWKMYADSLHEGVHGNVGNGTYRYDQVLSEHDGVLDAWLHTNAAGEHVIASIFPYAAFSQTYGRYEIRWRTTDNGGDGYALVGIVWPNSNDSTDGEIDHPEFTLGHNWIESSFIHNRAEHPTHHTAFGIPYVDTTQWHTTTIQWQPGLVVLYFDYVELGRSVPGAWVNQTPSRWGIQITTKPGAPAPANDAQTHILVDYAATWRYAP